MMVDIERLLGSGFNATHNDTAWRAGVTLWLRSFHQVPASTLPVDDNDLAGLAGFGRDLKSWKRVKEIALRGWAKGTDGRLHHRTVAEKALEAWIDKLLQRKSSGAGNAARYGHAFDAEAVETMIGAAVVRLTALNPHSKALRKKGVRISNGNPTGTPTGTPGGRPGGTTNGSLSGTPNDTPGGTPSELPVGSQERRREGNLYPVKCESSIPRAREDEKSPEVDLRVRLVNLWQELDIPAIPNTDRVYRWVSQGYRPDLIIAVIRERLSSIKRDVALSYFDKPIAEAHAIRAPKLAPVERTIYLSADMREVPESNARKMIMRFFENGSWPFHAGLKPDDPEFGAKDLLPERERARA